MNRVIAWAFLVIGATPSPSASKRRASKRRASKLSNGLWAALDKVAIKRESQ